jgi:phage tail sheath protein FI
MAFSESPAITVREVDASGVVPAVSSSTGAFVGNFRWGPVDQATLISNEGELAETFGTPTSANSVDYHSAAYFLKYTNALQVVRVLGDSDGFNAYNHNEAVNGKNVRVKDADAWDNALSGFDSDKHTFVAKWPGELGNSLRVSLCPQQGADSAFNGWTYKDNFDAAPGTSSFAEGLTAANDEIHVAIVDDGGKFTGTKGTILETYPFVSLASNAKTSDGSTNFVRDVINRKSEYIWMAGFDSDYTAANAGVAADTGKDYQLSAPVLAAKNYDLDSGDESANMDVGDYIAGFDKFEDKDNIQVDLMIAPQMNSRTDTTTIVNDLVSIAQGQRKDCVVVASPARSDIVGVNASAANTNAVTTAATFTSSSYLVVDNNFLKVYDKHNDEFIFIPANSSTAGIMAATDVTAATWFSPAGPRRGQYLGVTGLAYSPNKAQRDVLYRNGVNPIANIPGQGLLLFGDKTKLARPSAFDRINVRRLFLTIERAIAIAARNVMFEFNDEFTRAEFVGVVEPFLRDIKGRRGITDFRVVCDETNNTGAVIDRNEFVATVLVKPARSINFVTLNFVAVRTGVDFAEIAGV